MGLFEGAAAIREETRYAVGQDHFSDFSPASLPWLSQYGGNGWSGQRSDREQIENNFSGYVQGLYKSDGVVFACMVARQLVFSEARFQFRRMNHGRPGDLFGTPALDVLEYPWPNGTTGEMLSRMINDVDLAGNAYIVREGNRLRRRRPDWVQIILSAPPEIAVASDVEGYAYWPGGIGRNEPQIYLINEMCHWSPIPDPDAEYRGMSSLTPIVREIISDQAATTHKLAFFKNGAKLGPIFRLGADVSVEKFRQFKAAADETHVGPENAYKPLYVGGGADVTLASADMQQLDYRAIVGAGETRIAAALRVHPVIVGLSEGMQGSSLNAGNYAAAKRNFVDGTIRPLWRSVSAALASIVAVPSGADLWYDARDIPYLREDAKDAAAIKQIEASTMSSLVTAGWEKASIVAATAASDWTLLVDTGLVSVQLLPPGTVAKPDTAAPNTPTRAIAARKYNPDQPRIPGGHEGGGRWGGGVMGALLASLKAVGGLGGVQFGEDGDEGHIDWSTRHTDGGFGFDVYDGADTILFDATPEEMAGLHAALTKHLTHADDDPGVFEFGSEGDLAYIDWSGRFVAFGASDGEEISLELDEAQLQQWFQALTLSLLAEATGEQHRGLMRNFWLVARSATPALSTS